jgi:hypothetical protein
LAAAISFLTFGAVVSAEAISVFASVLLSLQLAKNNPESAMIAIDFVKFIMINFKLIYFLVTDYKINKKSSGSF